MPEASVTINGSIAGLPFYSVVTRSAAGHIAEEVPLPAAKSGTLTTRTDDDEGIITFETGHGLQQGDKIDIYWAGGRRLDITVGTVVGDAVPVSGGDGDVLPAPGTALTGQQQIVIDIDFVGESLVAIGALCTQRGRLDFVQEAGDGLNVDLAAGEVWSWFSGITPDNPLFGKEIVRAVVSQAATAAATFRLGVLYDSLG